MNGEQPKVLDLEVITMLQDAIGDSLHKIINLYLTDAPQDLIRMQQALSSNDLDTLRRLAHSLKSSSANLGAMQTSALAADLEHIITDGEVNPTLLTTKLNVLIASVDQARSMFETLQAR